MTTLLVSAGDASGDLHAAAFVRAFRARHPDARILGLGGDEMRRAGAELVVHQRNLAIGGLLELWRSLPKIVSTWRRMDRTLATAKPDLVVLVDSGGFNIPFARRVRRRCDAKILYFVAPQVWAWRPGRIQKLARRVDRIAVIFPFEPRAYSGTNLPVEFVGHPLMESFVTVPSRVDCDEARNRLGCEQASRIISVFPGSRRNEVLHHLPLQLAAIALLDEQFKGMQFLLAIAPTVSRKTVDRLVRDADLPAGLKLEVSRGRNRDVMLASDVALAKPGTVTLELSFLACPMVVVGHVNPLTALILRRAVRVPFYAMPNLVVGREVVPEFLQEEARPEAIARALAQLMHGPDRERQLKDLAEVREALSSPGAAQRVAEIAGEMLDAAGK